MAKEYIECLCPTEWWCKSGATGFRLQGATGEWRAEAGGLNRRRPTQQRRSYTISADTTPAALSKPLKKLSNTLGYHVEL